MVRRGPDPRLKATAGRVPLHAPAGPSARPSPDSLQRPSSLAVMCEDFNASVIIDEPRPNS